jgi:hypothetical protein
VTFDRRRLLLLRDGELGRGAEHAARAGHVEGHHLQALVFYPLLQLDQFNLKPGQFTLVEFRIERLLFSGQFLRHRSLPRKLVRWVYIYAF